ncbi:E1-E2 ATPase-domain containing protein [Nitzschia inconspicua]|uniref:E1-E2 ATPase-domain containing protein n=1 Tax=Nitzschia inconspicua TaxID=303405 RepID=A0A9K3LPP4_9STRA|nr:E1-E2 ATPase-domain containing protein [Nitzschia inconspicua]
MSLQDLSPPLSADDSHQTGTMEMTQSASRSTVTPSIASTTSIFPPLPPKTPSIGTLHLPSKSVVKQQPIKVHSFPAAPPLPSGLSSSPPGTFHPDFMFCGACTTCHEADTAAGSSADDTIIPSDELILSNSDLPRIKDGRYSDDDEFFILKNEDDRDNDDAHQTISFHFRQPLTKSSHCLVIQSLLRPIPGVHKVTLSKDHTRHYRSIQVEHDASIHIESLLQAFQAAGHPVFLERKPNQNVGKDDDETRNTSSDDSAHWVRSAFHVQGICCASEIPAVRKIVKPLPGVSKVNINLTTKVVHVQHNIALIQASDIASVLSTQGFPSQIRNDGAHTSHIKQQAMFSNSNTRRTTLHVQGVLQEGDVEKIRNNLCPLQGVADVGVNVDEGVIYVDHDISKISSDDCASHLRQQLPQCSCSVAVAAERAAGDAAAAALDSIGRSRYVESTFYFEGLQPYHIPIVENTISKNFIRAQARAVFANVPSETVKVEHDPKLVTANEICLLFQDFHRHSELPAAKVNIDGADANLYLPLQTDYPGNQGTSNDEPSLLAIHANVWLSGIFWVLSMVSLLDGKDWFKYFGLASVLFGLPPIALKAFRTLRRFQFDANCMMVTAATGALLLGEYDEAASVAFLFSVSEFLEARATLKARRALAEICALRPERANVIHPVTKEIVVVPADRVPLGSLISVRTGDKVAADGIVVEGSSAMDESSLTGEARPVSKQIGDAVSGGTVNVGQTQLVVKTTMTVEDSAVSRLIRLVEEAQSNQSPTEKMIDAFARSYTPSVMFISTFMCTIPWAFGVEIGRQWTLNGLIIIVIACPCALTISTPVTYAAGLAAAAQRGIIIKGGSKLEAMGSVDRIVFDKTGTLTKGSFSVTHLEVTSASKSRQEMLELLSLMQQRSSHPLSSSLVQAAKEEGVQIPRHVSVSDHQILKGEGITATINGTTQLYVGNRTLFNRLRLLDSLPDEVANLSSVWGSSGGTVGFIGSKEDGIFGIFCVKDEVREEAKSVIENLRRLGVDTLICTGDSDSTAQAVAKEIGIPSDFVHSQLLPEDKLHLVGSLKRPQARSCGMCRRHRYVLFVGDGVNDAPALAVADVGVSMGEGAAMALEMSDVTLMDSRLDKLAFSIQMGRQVLRTVKENIAISLVAKMVVVALTFAGKMTLLYAIGSDVGVMLLVTLNGMKLLPSKSLVEITHLMWMKRRAARQNFELIQGGNDGGEDSMESDASVAEIV